MNHTIQKIITFITVISLISSCSVRSNYTTNNPGVTNASCKEPSKSFSIKSVDNIVKPNDNFRINILKKNFDEPVNITSTYKFPLAETVEHQGVKIVPAVIKTIHHKALSPQEAKRKRKELWKQFHDFSKQKYKYEKEVLKNEQKQERIVTRESFHQLLKLYDKNSPERQDFINQQIELRKNIIVDQRDDRKQLKEKYKQEIEEFKKYLNNTYPKNFTVKRDCDISDPSCDYYNIDGLNDESVDFDYADSENSFQYNDTYVDGKPYSFSTQSVEPITTENPADYELGDAVEYAFNKKNIVFDNCTFDNVDVKKQGDKISFQVKASEQGCDFQKMTFRIQGNPDPKSCGQENESKIEIDSVNGYKKKDVRALIQLDFNSLFKQETINLLIDIITRDGKKETINVSDIVKPAESAGFNDVTITTEYTVDNIQKELFTTGKNQQQIEDYINANINNYKMYVTGIGSKGFKFVITDDSITPQNVGVFPNYPEIGKNILGSQCTLNTNESTGQVFYFDRNKFPTGKYHVFLLDKNDNLISDGEGRIRPKHSFFMGNLTASTYATDSPIAVNSEESRLPSEFGNYVVRNINASDLTVDEKNTVANTPNMSIEGCSLPIRNTNVNLNNFTERTYQNYVFDKLFGTDPVKKYNKFLNFKYPACKSNEFLIGGMVDLTNPDTKMNWKMFNEKRSVLMALTIEDEFCNEIRSYPFSAKVGSVHFINKSLEITDDPSKGLNITDTFINTKSIENKKLFIKIKKSFNTSRLELFQKQYSIEETNGGTTEGRSLTGYDFFSYVSNTYAKDQNPQYYGTKLELEKCEIKPSPTPVATPTPENCTNGFTTKGVCFTALQSILFRVSNVINQYPELAPALQDIYSTINSLGENASAKDLETAEKISEIIVTASTIHKQAKSLIVSPELQAIASINDELYKSINSPNALLKKISKHSIAIENSLKPKNKSLESFYNGIKNSIDEAKGDIREVQVAIQSYKNGSNILRLNEDIKGREYDITLSENGKKVYGQVKAGNQGDVRNAGSSDWIDKGVPGKLQAQIDATIKLAFDTDGKANFYFDNVSAFVREQIALKSEALFGVSWASRVRIIENKIFLGENQVIG